MKKQMNVEMKNFTNVVELYMEDTEMNYGVEMEMAKLSERFLGSARLLPKQDFLGWQIVLKKGERILLQKEKWEVKIFNGYGRAMRT